MPEPRTYPGIDNDVNAGMTSIGKIIRDAKVFGLIEDSETCEGWNLSRLDVLLHKVDIEWDKYSCLVSQLPEDLFKRHQEIYEKAVKDAKAAGWSGEQETDDDT